MAAPVVFNSSPALPKDPVLRKEHLEDLMTDIHGSFTFMQVKSDNARVSPAGPLPSVAVRLVSGLCSGQRALIRQEPPGAEETIASLCSR